MSDAYEYRSLCLSSYIAWYELFLVSYFFVSTLNKKSIVCLRPQIAKANRGGRSYTQSVVKLVIIKLQQYNNIRLNTTILN